MQLRRLLRSRVGLGLALAADLLMYGGPHRSGDAFLASLDAALVAQSEITADWIDLEGVVGTAVGLGHSGEAVVDVFLDAPDAAALPTSVRGVAVRARVTGPFVALTLRPTAAAEDVDPKQPFPRPVPIGVSTGHPDVSAGTIGARVTDGSRVFALSNNHVFAASNGGSPGDNLLQPGVVDGGRNPDDVIGTLFDFEPLEFCSGPLCPSNLIDAALALTTADDLGFETPAGGYGAPRSSPLEATLGQAVQKFGRTTGPTEGRITGLNATLDVDYRVGMVRFVGQLVISGAGFSGPGDSGSLIVSKDLFLGDRRPVGLLFAGSRTNTIANPIGLVLERFGVTVDGE